MRRVDIPTPTPGPGEIRVRHEAIGLNFIDTYHRSGLYPLTYPARLGMEGAGVVDEIGAGVTRFRVGDRVGYMSGPPGSYADGHIVRADQAVALPQDIPSDLAAAGLLKGLTAEVLVRRVFHVKHGQDVLIHAAAGGVGQILCQWASSVAARVIGTVGSEEKARIAREAGCHDVILYRDQDVASRVRELTSGKGVEVVYDGVGAATFDGSLASLARRGMLVTFGNASGPVPAVEPLRLLHAGSVFLTRPRVQDYLTTPEELDEAAGALFDAIRSGAVRIRIDNRLPLDRVREAHEALESRATVGSTILLP